MKSRGPAVIDQRRLRVSRILDDGRFAKEPRSAWRIQAMIIIRGALAAVLTVGLLVESNGADAQAPANVQRVGVIHISGHHRVVVDGLRQGLRDLGLEEGKHVVLDIRETQGDMKTAQEAARELERAKVDLLYTVTSQLALAAKSATAQVPIVFYVGADPIALGPGLCGRAATRRATQDDGC
jgi:ABC-type uncharacterized transport system substrate-binding protein